MKSKLSILAQVAAWGAFLFSPFILFPKPPNLSQSITVLNFISFILTNLCFVIYYYLNYYVVIPRLFFTRKYFLYLLITAGFLLFIFLISGLFHQDMPPHIAHNHMPWHEHSPDGFMINPFRISIILIFLLISLASLGIRITSQWQRVEQEKTNAELSYLKAQINPHFLFNTLNTIYSMAIKNSDSDTANAIIKLSEMMRFVITETHNDFVLLEEELNYINNYVELQKLRLGKNMRLTYKIEGNTIGKKIAPMTLMPFIENAFKYGVTTERSFDIIIIIKSITGYIQLDVTNMKLPVVKNSGDTGLGIKNTLKRLELVYPSNYTINIDEDGNLYRVSLKINIS